MSDKTSVKIQGALMQVVYGSKGGVEGVLLEANGVALQLVIERDDGISAEAFTGIAEGQTVVVEASPQGAPPEGDAVHALYEFGRLVSVDGKGPIKTKLNRIATYQGNVVRFNFSRHGVANGVVLDSGDVIHTSPGVLAQLKLKVGDPVHADGDAYLLAAGLGWAVDASTVNGKPVKAHLSGRRPNK